MDEKSCNRQTMCFIHKLFQMATCPANEDVIRFSADGLELEICEDPRLISPTLRQFFRHGNIPSLLRQLHNYGFRRVNPRTETDGSLRTYFKPGFHRHCTMSELKAMGRTQTKSSSKRKVGMNKRIRLLENRNAALEAENAMLRAVIEQNVVDWMQEDLLQ